MIGAIIGDIVGSRFEFDNYRAKDFELFTKDCVITDDSVMSLALAKSVIDYKNNRGDLSKMRHHQIICVKVKVSNQAKA